MNNTVHHYYKTSRMERQTQRYAQQELKSHMYLNASYCSYKEAELQTAISEDCLVEYEAILCRQAAVFAPLSAATKTKTLWTQYVPSLILLSSLINSREFDGILLQLHTC